jgi:hypothetical protein
MRSYPKNTVLVGIGAATAVFPTALLFLQVNLLFTVPLIVGIAVSCVGLTTNKGSKPQIPAIILAGCAWVVPFVVTSILRRSGLPIEFVVPDDFHGSIELVKDRKGGYDLNPKGGKYVIVVPATGVLRIKDGSPFHRWHTESCRDTSGKPRNLEGGGVTAGSRQTGLGSSDGSTDCDGTTYYWVVR